MYHHCRRRQTDTADLAIDNRTVTIDGGRWSCHVLFAGSGHWLLATCRTTREPKALVRPEKQIIAAMKSDNHWKFIIVARRCSS